MNTIVNSEHLATRSDAAEAALFARNRRAPNFNRLAKLYFWMELATFGPFLARCRGAFLTELVPARRAVVLGDGDGRFTSELLCVNSQVRIDAVDVSQAMLDALLIRAGENAGRVSAHCGDARDWQPANPPYDLIVSHFFLDCLTTEEIRALAVKVRSAVSPSAIWIVSDFAVPRNLFGRWVARPLISLLYRAFGILTGLKIRSLPDHHLALRNAGFTLTQRQCWLRGLLVSEMWRCQGVDREA
jgi:SAM-dependent methyltransferase